MSQRVILEMVIRQKDELIKNLTDENVVLIKENEKLKAELRALKNPVKNPVKKAVEVKETK